MAQWVTGCFVHDIQPNVTISKIYAGTTDTFEAEIKQFCADIHEVLH